VREKSYYTNCPVLPPIDENGWNIQDGVYIPVSEVPHSSCPQAVLELTKCGCISQDVMDLDVVAARMLFLALLCVNVVSLNVPT